MHALMKRMINTGKTWSFQKKKKKECVVDDRAPVVELFVWISGV